MTSSIQGQLDNITSTGSLTYGYVSTKSVGDVNSAGTELSSYGQYRFTVTVNATGDYTIFSVLLYRIAPMLFMVVLIAVIMNINVQYSHERQQTGSRRRRRCVFN